MPNIKVLVEEKWLTFVVGKDGVKNVFASDKGTAIVLGEDGITEMSGFPFVLERDYKKSEKS